MHTYLDRKMDAPYVTPWFYGLFIYLMDKGKKYPVDATKCNALSDRGRFINLFNTGQRNNSTDVRQCSVADYPEFG